jgi:hypothetical protein
MTALASALAEQIVKVETARLALREEVRKLEELSKKAKSA